MLDFSVDIYRFTARKTVDDLDEAADILRAYLNAIRSQPTQEPFTQAEEDAAILAEFPKGLRDLIDTRTAEEKSEAEALLSARTAGVPRPESAGLARARLVSPFNYKFKYRQGTGSAIEWLFEEAAKREGALVLSGGYPNLVVCTSCSIRTQFAESSWLTEEGLTAEQLVGDAADDELIVMVA